MGQICFFWDEIKAESRIFVTFVWVLYAMYPRERKWCIVGKAYYNV